MKTVTKKKADAWVEGKQYQLVTLPGYEDRATLKILKKPYKDIVVVFEDIQITKTAEQKEPLLSYAFILPSLTEDVAQSYHDSETFKETISAMLTAAINKFLVVND